MTIDEMQDRTPMEPTTSATKADGPSLKGGQLPTAAPWITAAIALGIGLLGWMLTDSLTVAALIGWLTFVVVFSVWSRLLEGSRKGVDRFITVLVWSAFALAMIPLISVVWSVLANGVPAISGEFLTAEMRNVLGEGGGIYHAIWGTVIITGLATLMAVPIGVLAAIYLVEYGRGKRLAKIITFLVDVMTGIPSIVAGLFALALFIVITGNPLPRLGIGGAVALALLMLPTVTRSTEEMLKLVPDELREASYALGVSKWRTIVKVVLPTAVAGIVTGVTLAVARVAGETAPLLVIAGTTDSTSFNPFDGPMMTIPVFIFSSQNFMSGSDGAIWTDRLWGAALVLIVIVMALNLIARLIGKYFAPATGGR